MSLFDRPIAPETYAVVRFGLGFPAHGTPLSAQAILDRLRDRDAVLDVHPMLPFSEAAALTQAIRQARKDLRQSMTDDRSALKAAQHAQRDAFTRTLLDEFRRGVATNDPFRERLAAFWANHFTANTRSYFLRAGHAGYAAQVIRPHVTGRFADMLYAVATHPFMLSYLDQRVSMGPNSVVGLKRGRGLNENYARELLELHTLGAGGGYDQRDVQQLAELLTGLSSSKTGDRFIFREDWVEPGAEEVLGRRYGGAAPALADIRAVLEDLALHPSTARHLAYKLAAHFVADDPDPAMVDDMAAAYLDGHGALMPLYEALLKHPLAWQGFGAKAKSPLEFMVSAMRALGFKGAHFDRFALGPARKRFLLPLSRMGQPYALAPSPEGWPDQVKAWITPQGLAARIDWVQKTLHDLRKTRIDPREFVFDALSDLPSPALQQAARGAETRAEGMMLVLASAEFNRR